MNEIYCNPNFACQKAYIGETSKQLQNRLNFKQHCQSSYNGNDSAVFKNIILSGHQIDVNDVTITDIENWFERGVKEAVRVIKNHSLNCNSGTRITPSHSLDGPINNTQLFSICENFRKYEINQKLTPPPVVTTTTIMMKASGTSRNIGLHKNFSFLVAKN